MNYYGSYLLETVQWLGAKVIFPSICVCISIKEHVPCSLALLKIIFVCKGGICVYVYNQIYFNILIYHVYICIYIGVCVYTYLFTFRVTVCSPWPMGLPPLPNHRPHLKWRSCGMCYD